MTIIISSHEIQNFVTDLTEDQIEKIFKFRFSLSKSIDEKMEALYLYLDYFIHNKKPYFDDGVLVEDERSLYFEKTIKEFYSEDFNFEDLRYTICNDQFYYEPLYHILKDGQIPTWWK